MAFGHGLIHGLLQLQGLDGGLQRLLFGEEHHLERQFCDGAEAALQDRPGGVIAAHAIHGDGKSWPFHSTGAAGACLAQAQRAQG